MEREKYYGTIALDRIILNEHTPLTYSKQKFDEYKRSLTKFPEILELRPIIINEDYVLLGDNRRILALQELGYDAVPFIQVIDLDHQQQVLFTEIDNIFYDETTRKKTKQKTSKLDNRQDVFLDKLEKNFGNVVDTLEQLKLTKEELDLWMEEFLFRNKFDEIQEKTLDYVENKLLQQINEGNLSAITFYLKTKGKNRGYV